MPHSHRFETLERRRLLAAGDIDLTYGGDDGDGVVNTGRWHDIHPMPNDDVLIGIGLQWNRINTNGAVVDTIDLTGGNLPDTLGILPLASGKFLTEGHKSILDPLFERFDRAEQLQRHNADGTLDTTFGENGVGELTFSDDDLNFSLMTFAVQPDGKILVSARGSIWRLTEAGHVDPTLPMRDLRETFNISVIIPQPDGKILLFGDPQTIGGGGGRVGLMRLNADATTDSTFGDAGVVTLGPTGSNTPRDVKLAADGSILVGLGAVGQIQVRQFTPGGELDTDFGDGGTATVPLPNRADANVSAGLHVLDGGDILVTASAVRVAGTDSGSAAVRLNADGSLDEGFPRLTSPTSYFEQGVVTTGGRLVFGTDLSHDLVDAPDALMRLLIDDTGDGPVTLSGGVLDIDGTARGERIRVTRFGADLEVAPGNGFDRLIEAADVSMIDISASGGDDVVILAAGPIPATVSGGDGHDRIAGGAGDDSLSGNAGNDRIDGGPGGANRIAGNGGRDKLTGGPGGDRIFGGNGGDWLAGQDRGDRLFGGDGDDFFDGGRGADQIVGDAGNDSAAADDDDELDGIENVLP